MPHISLKFKFSVIDKWQWHSVPGTIISHFLLKMGSGCFWKSLGPNCTTACVLFKSPKLKVIHQKLVPKPHNYQMLIFCSEEDSRNTFWTTHNSGSLWKNLCYRSKSLPLRKRYSQVCKMLSLVFLNVALAEHKTGFILLLFEQKSLKIELNWYCELIIEHGINDTHKACFQCRKKETISPFTSSTQSAFSAYWAQHFDFQ